jgi:hypothetical protein
MFGTSLPRASSISVAIQSCWPLIDGEIADAGPGTTLRPQGQGLNHNVYAGTGIFDNSCQLPFLSYSAFDALLLIMKDPDWDPSVRTTRPSLS